MGSETLASPSAEVWISFLFPHHSVLTSSVSHFCNDCQVQGRIFFFFFLSSGNADSFICEKCLCVFDFGLRYLTLGSAGLNSSHFWHWVTLKARIPWKEVVVFGDLKENRSIGRSHVLKYTIWFVMLVQSRINRFWDWAVPTSLVKSVWNEGFNDPNGSKRQFSSDLWEVYV